MNHAIKSIQLEKTIQDANSDSIVTIILLQDGRMASSSIDKTVKIYELKNYHCDITINAHLETVTYINQLPNVS